MQTPIGVVILTSEVESHDLPKWAVQFLAYSARKKLIPPVIEARKHRLQRYVEYLQQVSIEDPLQVKYRHVTGFLSDLGQNGVRNSSTLQIYKSMLVRLHTFFEEDDRYREPALSSDRICGLSSEMFAQESLGAQREPLTVDEMTELLQATTNRRDELLVHMMFFMGLRNEEVRNLRISELDFEDLTAYLHGKQDRVVPVPDTFSDEIQDFIETERQAIPGADEHDFLFPSHAGGRLSGARIRNIFKDMAERAGIQRPIGMQSNGGPLVSDRLLYHAVTPHAIRYSVVNHMMTDVPNHVLTRFLGLHSHPDMHATRPSVDEMYDLIRSAIEDIISGIDR